MPAALKQPVHESDFDLYEEYYAHEARKSLWAYRQYIDPELKKGWWVAEISDEFQNFYERLINNERPKLVIEAPPQHGKSRGLQDAISWMSGKQPDLRTLYASFSDDLGNKTNKYLQRVWDDRSKHGRVFPAHSISTSNSAGGEGRWARNDSLLEFVGRKGLFNNVTVQGQVTGKGLDLGVIDDPLKGRNEAQSKTIRDRTWNWLLDDFFSRFSEYAGLIVTMTRWHVDDPVGRFLKQFPDARVLKYPAEYFDCTLRKDEEGKPIFRNDAFDPRSPGEPLFPEFKSKAFLEERKGAYTKASWESLYQQMPIISGGGTFPIDKFRFVPNAPTPSDVKKSVRYWDKAGTANGGKYSCGVLFHLLHDGQFVVSDVVRGQWSSWDRERMIANTAEKDYAAYGHAVEIWVEQEPGSGGKESAERTIAMLRGYKCYADKVTGSKETRAEPYAAQQQAGNIKLVSGKWTQLFVDEHEVFPSGQFMDQVDAAAGAFAKLVNKKYRYDSSMAWVGV